METSIRGLRLNGLLQKVLAVAPASLILFYFWFTGGKEFPPTVLFGEETNVRIGIDIVFY